MVTKQMKSHQHLKTKEKLPSTFVLALKDCSIFGYISVVIAFYLWYILVTPQWKLAVIVISLCYYIMETIYTGFVDYLPDGSIVWETRPRLGHSTAEQFIVNVFYVPFLIFIRSFIWLTLLRILLTPVLIWLLEILEGHTLLALFGYNRAWQYSGPFALCNRQIQLKLWWIWLIFGVVVEIGFRTFVEPILGKNPIFFL